MSSLFSVLLTHKLKSMVGFNDKKEIPPEKSHVAEDYKESIKNREIEQHARKLEREKKLEAIREKCNIKTK